MTTADKVAPAGNRRGQGAPTLCEPGTFVGAMARRARKYYPGLVTITQQVADLADEGHGETILTNSAQVLLLQQKAEQSRPPPPASG